MLALFMGLRQGEILGLAWDCINWENNVITIKRQLIRKRECKIIQVNGDEKYKLATVKDIDPRYICVDDEIMDIFRTRLKEQNEQRQKAKDLWWEPIPNLVFENEFGKPGAWQCTAEQLSILEG